MKTLTAKEFRQIFKNAEKVLRNRKPYLNDLNVFPVPDGDTGTNMHLTMVGGVTAIKNLPNKSSLPELLRILAEGMLNSARGNSGVLFAQFVKGLAEEITSDEVDNEQIAKAINKGFQTAYAAIEKPKEGTILSVMRRAAEAAYRYQSLDLVDFWEKILQEAKEEEARTPELLPILKAANVVDAGGEGFVAFLETVVATLKRKKLPLLEKRPTVTHLGKAWASNPDFRYCVEFVIGGDIDSSQVKFTLNPFGNSLLVAKGQEATRVHIHTNQPEDIKLIAMQFGPINQIKVDDMSVQHQELLFTRESAVVAIADGLGFEKIFKNMGASAVLRIRGAQKPSVEELCKLVEKAQGRKVFLSPNNENILLAAREVEKINPERVVVIPTKSMAEGVAALIAYNPDDNWEVSQQTMLESVSYVHEGKVGKADKEGQYGEKKVVKGNFIGILNDEIKTVSNDLNTAALDLLKEMVSPESELITIFYGTGYRSAASQLRKSAKILYPTKKIEIQYGGQSFYPYIFSVS